MKRERGVKLEPRAGELLTLRIGPAEAGTQGGGVRDAIPEPFVTRCQAPLLHQDRPCFLNDARGKKEKATLALLGKDLHRSLTPPNPPLGVMGPPVDAGQG